MYSKVIALISWPSSSLIPFTPVAVLEREGILDTFVLIMFPSLETITIKSVSLAAIKALNLPLRFPLSYKNSTFLVAIFFIKKYKYLYFYA